LAVFIFTFAILLSLGVFGYEFYLKANISKMTGNLATARASLEPETIKQISDLDSRIISTRDLLESHIVLSPLFDYLENSTLKGVRFTQFQYQTTEKGLELSMRGQARGYSAVALQSDIFNKGQYFDEPIFADLDLDERGNVTFSFRALVDPSIVSYQKEITASSIDEPVSAIVTPTGTSVSTSSPQATPQ
jgi:hypothetical protein